MPVDFMQLVSDVEDLMGKHIAEDQREGAVYFVILKLPDEGVRTMGTMKTAREAVAHLREVADRIESRIPPNRGGAGVKTKTPGVANGLPVKYWNLDGKRRWTKERDVCTCASCCKGDPTRVALRKTPLPAEAPK